MNLSFPLIPMNTLLAERLDSLAFMHLWLSAVLTLILAVIGLWGLLKMGHTKEYDRSNARESWMYLGLALMFAVFGMYPFLVIILVLGIFCLAWIIYLLFRYIIWEFLIKWLFWECLIKWFIWGVFIKTFQVAFFPEKPVKKTKAKAKTGHEGHGEGSS